MEKLLININAYVENLECKVVVENEQAYADVSFNNLGRDVITAIKFKAVGYNSFGDIVKVNENDSFTLLIQDLNIERNGRIDSLKSKLPDNTIRKLDLIEEQICYSDNNVISCLEPDIVEVDVENYADKDFYVALKDKFGEHIKSSPVKTEQGWICSCQRYNSADELICNKCGNSKEEILSILDPAFTTGLLQDYNKKQQHLSEIKVAEQKKLEKEQKKNNIIKCIALIMCVILGYFIWQAVLISGRTTYKSDREMKRDIVGVYRHEDDFYWEDQESRYIQIEYDKVHYVYGMSGNSMGSQYTCMPEKGIIHTFEDIIITKEGFLKRDDDLYIRDDSVTISHSDGYFSIQSY